LTEYNNLIIFDLDGVLIDSRELHYNALNDALIQVGWEPISKDHHLSTYDGLPTTAKLKKLTEECGLPTNLYDTIWQYKQDATFRRLSYMTPNETLIDIFKTLKSQGYQIAVASNSIRNTVKISLSRLGLMDFVDYYQSNEDVKYNKPYPQMYWNCMVACKAIPATTLIIEDSHIGRQGALDSGAKLMGVESTHDITFENIQQHLTQTKKENIPWRDSRLNVVIPMAGAGSRFSHAGYKFPKPLIEVKGKPMIQVVLENLNIEANYIFLVQKDHYVQYNLKYMLNALKPGCKIVQVDGITEGAACTVLKAKEHINNDDRLLIVNSDQYVEWNSNEVMYAFAAENIDGGIVTFESIHPKFSYVGLGEDRFVTRVVEKQVISNMATVGFYYWAKGHDFVESAEEMIAKNHRYLDEFYIAPVYQEAIDRGEKFRIKQVDKFWSLGTPEDLNYFLQEHP